MPRLHPVIYQRGPQVDLLYGGNESIALEESIRIASDGARAAQKGYRILYVNTLCSDRQIEHMMDREVRHRKRVDTITLCGSRLVEKLEFLTKAVKDRGVQLVILNSFEFSGLNSRQRIEVFRWLKALRDDLDVGVIIFTQTAPGNFGTMGQMKYIANSMTLVGEFKKAVEEPAVKHEPTVRQEPAVKLEPTVMQEPVIDEERVPASEPERDPVRESSRVAPTEPTFEAIDVRAMNDLTELMENWPEMKKRIPELQHCEEVGELVLAD